MRGPIVPLVVVWVALSFAARALAQEPTILAEPIKVTACEPQQTTIVSTPFVGPYYPGYPYFAPYPYLGYYPMWPYGAWYGYGYMGPGIVSTTGTLTLHYANQTDKVMKIIDFGLVANGTVVAKVRDVGKFSPGIEIKHDFALSTNVFPVQSIPLCAPLEITFEDGSTWTNPNLVRPRRQIPEPESEPSPGNIPR